MSSRLRRARLCWPSCGWHAQRAAQQDEQPRMQPHVQRQARTRFFAILYMRFSALPPPDCSRVGTARTRRVVGGNSQCNHSWPRTLPAPSGYPAGASRTGPDPPPRGSPGARASRDGSGAARGVTWGQHGEHGRLGGAGPRADARTPLRAAGRCACSRFWVGKPLFRPIATEAICVCWCDAACAVRRAEMGRPAKQRRGARLVHSAAIPHASQEHSRPNRESPPMDKLTCEAGWHQFSRRASNFVLVPRECERRSGMEQAPPPADDSLSDAPVEPRDPTQAVRVCERPRWQVAA